MKISTVSVFTILILFLTSCGDQSKKHSHAHHKHHNGDDAHHHDHHHHHHGEANEHMHQTSFEELVERFEGEERDAYQKPGEVVNYLGAIKGKTIIDIGAGTGYFSFPLAKAGATVLAADVDQRFLDFIKDKRTTLGMSDQQVIPKKVPYDSPDLKEKEVDMAIIVNTYHHIEKRSQYFSKVKKGLKPNGELVVIDFFKKETPMGPPVKMKMSEEQVIKELKSAGFQTFDVNDTLLPFQYIIRAK